MVYATCLRGTRRSGGAPPVPAVVVVLAIAGGLRIVDEESIEQSNACPSDERRRQRLEDGHDDISFNSLWANLSLKIDDHSQ